MTMHTAGEHRELVGLTEARRMAKARKGQPTDADRPRRKGRPPPVLDGQLDLAGNVHHADGTVERRTQDAA